MLPSAIAPLKPLRASVIVAKTSELLWALEYHDQRERLDSLRAQIMEADESLVAIALDAEIDRRTLQRFVNQGVILHETTIDKLEAAVRRMRVANRPG